MKNYKSCRVYLDELVFSPQYLWWRSGSFYMIYSLLIITIGSDESITKVAVALMGDLADALGSDIKLLFRDTNSMLISWASVFSRMVSNSRRRKLGHNK